MYTFSNVYVYTNPIGAVLNPVGSITPFVHWIEDYPLLDGLKMPSRIGSYDGKGDPNHFLHLFEGAIRMQRWLMSVACHMFTYTLKDSAKIWWNSQKLGSILDYKDLTAKFRSHLSQQKKFTKTHLVVHNNKQREGESTRVFITRYTDDTLDILRLHEEQRISSFVHGLRTGGLVEHLSTDLPSTYKGLMEKTYTWVEAREATTNGALNDRRDSFERSKKISWDNNRGQKNKDRFSPYRGPNHGLLYSLSKSLKEILATENDARSFELPLKMFRRIKKERTKSSDTPRGESKKDKGTSPAEAPILMTVTIGKQLPEHFKKELQNLLKSNTDVFIWTHADIKGISRTIMVEGKPFNMEHKLNEYSHVKPIKQNKRGLGLDHNMAACKETEELTKAWILQKGSGFLDAYKGYHQIQMAEEDEEKNSLLRNRRSLLLQEDAVWSQKYRGNIPKVSGKGRVAKWAIELKDHDIVFLRRNEKETPTDFLVEIPFEDNEKKEKPKEVPNSNSKEYTYALRFEFETTNNEAEYEALLAANQTSIKDYLQKVNTALRGFEEYTVEHVRMNQNKKVDALSKLASMTFEHLKKEGVVEVLTKMSIEEKEVLKVDILERESWMDPIHEYMLSGLLPEDTKEARKIRIQAPQYKLIRGNLYKRSFFMSWLRCVAPP
nr:reverse transcriptase domain-containing protein [Tanacetum cinerariifolium]